MNLRILLLACSFALAGPLHAQTPFGTALPAQASSVVSTHEVMPGDTLDAILSHAGISAATRNEAALAIADVFDLSTLSPGQSLSWTVSEADPTKLDHLSLLIEDGTDIILDFSKPLSATVIKAETRLRDRREVLVLEGSLYEALISRNAPERFAVDLSALLASEVDFRRDLTGGERLALIWQESVLADGTTISEPRLSYARLELRTAVYELMAASPDEPVILFKDGLPVQQSARPVVGARLSSVFGKRKHPVLGVQRLHTGVDYAAPVGTPVRATGAGKVRFAGTMRGYGRVIDIDHGSGVVTRYAHLSRFARGLAPGAELQAGDRIGEVGATGLVSGPNLHYEVRVNGEPTDPSDTSPAPRAIVPRTGDRVLLAAARVVTGFFIGRNTNATGI